MPEDCEEPSELPAVLNGEGTPIPRPLKPPRPPVVSVGLFKPEVTPNSGVAGPLFLYIIPVPILDRCLDGSRSGDDTWGIEEVGTGTGLGRLLEFLRSGEGEAVAVKGPECARFLEPKLPVGRTPGFDVGVSLTIREPGEFPKELDLSIEELVASFNGLGPLDNECVRGERSITPNSDVLGVLLSDGFDFNVRGAGVVGVVG